MALLSKKKKSEGGTLVAEPKDQAAHIIAYKGFDKDLQCRGFQYEVGKEYEHAGKVEQCAAGFHACENPIDVFGYYGPGESRFAEVELSGEFSRGDGDSKIAAAKIHIKAELSLPDFIGKAVGFILAQVDWKNAKESNTGNRSAATNTGYQSAATNTGYQSAATNTGNRSAATNTGDQSAATNTGNRSAATNTGNRSAATNTGNQSAATNTGYQSAATNTGDQSAATNTGDQSAATNTGNRSAATNTGDQSAATNTGYQSAATNTGKEAVAMASGYMGRVSGSLGNALFLVERDDNYKIIAAWAGIVGQNKIKPDTFYFLKNGKPKEWSE